MVSFIFSNKFFLSSSKIFAFREYKLSLMTIVEKFCRHNYSRVTRFQDFLRRNFYVTVIFFLFYSFKNVGNYPTIYHQCLWRNKVSFVFCRCRFLCCCCYKPNFDIWWKIRSCEKLFDICLMWMAHFKFCGH